MTSELALPLRDSYRVGDMELVLVLSDGLERREPLMSAWSTRFEDVQPVRSAADFCGQRHYPGWWWFASTGQHVWFESWLEREHIMLLDFDPAVVGLAAQPFWLLWSVDGRRRRHAPDLFARLADGTGVVIDICPDDRVRATNVEETASKPWPF